MDSLKSGAGFSLLVLGAAKATRSALAKPYSLKPAPQNRGT
jgi:hypothetical protein